MGGPREHNTAADQQVRQNLPTTHQGIQQKKSTGDQKIKEIEAEIKRLEEHLNNPCRHVGAPEGGGMADAMTLMRIGELKEIRDQWNSIGKPMADLDEFWGKWQTGLSAAATMWALQEDYLWVAGECGYMTGDTETKSLPSLTSWKGDGAPANYSTTVSEQRADIGKLKDASNGVGDALGYAGNQVHEKYFKALEYGGTVLSRIGSIVECVINIKKSPENLIGELTGAVNDYLKLKSLEGEILRGGHGSDVEMRKAENKVKEFGSGQKWATVG